MEDRLTFYHLSHVDLDGYGAQAIIDSCKGSFGYSNSLLWEGYDVKYFNSNYGDEILEKLEMMKNEISRDFNIGRKNAFVLITDLNLTEEAALYVEKELIPLVGEDKLKLLDHHASGEEVSKGRDWYHLDTSKSATMLTYDFILERNFTVTSFINPKFQNLVDSYDLWKKDNKYKFKTGKLITFFLGMISNLLGPSSNREDVYAICREFVIFMSTKHKITDTMAFEAMTVAFRKYVKYKHLLVNDEVVDVSEFNIQDSVENIIVNSILEQMDNNKDNTGYVEDEENNKVAIVVTSNTLSSAVMNTILERRPKYKAIASVSHNGTMSLRANGEYNVSVLARRLGGGGHPNASGCKIEELRSENWKKDVIERYKRNMGEVLTSEQVENELIKFYLGYITEILTRAM